jgi:hypothetical protein
MDVILGLFKSLPEWLMVVIMIMGSLRLVVKPVLELVKAIVLITPSKNDDELPAKIEKSGVYKAVIFVLDWFASIKPVKK